MEEIFVDIVDDQDEVIVTKPLSRALQDGLLHQIRMVKLFIKNYDGQLLLCRNFSLVKTAENSKKGQDFFDCPLTAIVHAGESYDEALIRAVQETFGFDMTDMPFHELGKLSLEDGLDCFTQVYELTYNELPDFSTTKFNDFMWETPLDIITQFSRDPQGEKSLSICLKYFYFDCQDNFSC